MSDCHFRATIVRSKSVFDPHEVGNLTKRGTPVPTYNRAGSTFFT